MDKDVYVGIDVSKTELVVASQNLVHQKSNRLIRA
jgi:hypothetical protein